MDLRPYHNRQKKLRAFRIKLYLLLGIFGFASIVGVYIFINAPFLKIKSIEIIGLEKIPREEIFSELQSIILESQFAQILGLKHFVSWPNQIVLKNPLVANALIEKNYFDNRLLINVTERKNYSIWCYIRPELEKSCYWFNREGILLTPAPTAEGSLVFVINDKTSRPPILGEKVAPDHLWNNTQKILEVFTDLPLKIKEFVINENLQELAVYGSGGEKLIFSTRFAPSEKIIGFVQEAIDTGALRKSEYVDFTVENRIYTKP